MKQLLALPVPAVLLAGGCAAPDAPITPAGAGGAYSLDYVWTLPADAVADVQRQHAALCARLGAARCRVRLEQLANGGADGGSLTLDLVRGAAPAAIADLLETQAAAGGRQQSAEMTMRDAVGVGGSPGRAAAIVPVTLRYSARRGFAVQVVEALAAFLPTIAASVGTMVVMFPALLPWLVVIGALLFAGESMLRRRRQKRR